MNNHTNQSAIKASNISLMPYYILGLVGTGMGIVVVAVLNFFTPLEPIQDLILGGCTIKAKTQYQIDHPPEPL